MNIKEVFEKYNKDSTFEYEDFITKSYSGGHYKMLTRYPRVNELVDLLKKDFKEGIIDYNFIKNNFSGELANWICGKESGNPGISYSFYEENNTFIKDYRKPQLIDYCNAYDLKHSKLAKNTWVNYDVQTIDGTTVGQSMRLDVFLKTEASFRKISNSVISVHDKGHGIFSKEGNLKGNDYENLGEFKFLLQIDTMNYKKDVDALMKMYHWKVNRNEKRNKMEAEFGVDLKHMSHLYRLMIQAKKILQNGFYNPRLEGEDLKMVKGVRDGSLWGKQSYDKGIKFAEEMDAELNELYKTTTLQKKVNLNKINDLVLELRLK